MSGNGIAKASDFKAALERASIERVVLPASGLPVVLCRPPVFASLAMGREGTRLQARISDAEPDDIQEGDVEAFTQWLTESLTRLFVQPRFAAAPKADEIGLADILLEDLRFIYRWLRGEIVGSTGSQPVDSTGKSAGATYDLGEFPGGQGAAAVPGGSGEAKPLSPERTPGAHRHAGLPPGLHRC